MGLPGPVDRVSRWCCTSGMLARGLGQPTLASASGAPVGALPLPLLTRHRSTTTAVGSVGAPCAVGHPCQSQVSRAREQGSSRAGAGSGFWAGQMGARSCPHFGVLGLAGRGAQGRDLAGHVARVLGEEDMCLRSPPAAPKTGQEVRPLEGAHEGAAQLGCRHEFLRTVCYKEY